MPLPPKYYHNAPTATVLGVGFMEPELNYSKYDMWFRWYLGVATVPIKNIYCMQ